MMKICGNYLKKIRFDAEETKDITISLQKFIKNLYPDVIAKMDD